MKRISIFLMIMIIFFSVHSMNAYAYEEDSYYVNRMGVHFTESEYNDLLERFGIGFVATVSNKLAEEALQNKEMILLTEPIPILINDNPAPIYYYPCSLGNIESKNYDDFYVCANYTENSSNSKYYFELYIEWNPLYISRMEKYFDILAMRWDSNFVVESYTGEQFNGISVVNYSNNGKNSKRAANGAGISMNVMDDTSELLRMSTTLIGHYTSKTLTTINMTYVHAYKKVTLEQSQSYKFSPTVNGQVLQFDNSTIKSYYQTPVPIYKTFTPRYIV